MINNINILNYTGIVNLKLIDLKTKRIKSAQCIHNNGTKYLFKFLCNALAGKINNDLLPRAIDASKNVYKGGENEVLTSSLAYRVLLSGQKVISDFEVKDEKQLVKDTFPYIVRFSTIIPYSAILVGDGGEINNLQLHSSLSQIDKTESLLAYINLKEAVTVSEGEALLIEWNMGFKNPPSELST